MATTEEGFSTMKKIKSNMSKICFNRSNKLNGDFKDDQIEIILDNKNITPKPIYFNFQEAETKKSFDQIDYLLKQFDDKNEFIDEKGNTTKETDEANHTGDIIDGEPKRDVGGNDSVVGDDQEAGPKVIQYEEDFAKSYNEIRLSESETIILLNIPNMINDTEEEKAATEEKNQRYEKLIKNDESNYINKTMQTLNVFRKNKDVFVSTINKQNKSSQTNLHELHKLTIRNPSDISELLHKKFLKYRNKKLKKIMDEYGDSLNINERVILKKNMWVQVVDKNVVDNKQTTIIPKSFYKSKKNNTSLFNTLFSTKNMSRTLSNKSRTFRTRSKFKNMKTMKFLTSSFSEDEYLIKSIIKKKREQAEASPERPEDNEGSANFIPWKINNQKKNLNKGSFVDILKNMEKYVVQNVYYYEQLLYKNIHLSYLNDMRKNNKVKMFDGENYDALTNPNINYKKKKTIIRMKIKINLKKAINFYKINKCADIASEEEMHEERSAPPLKGDPQWVTHLDLLKRVAVLSKRKKKNIRRQISAGKLRTQIRRKAARRRTGKGVRSKVSNQAEDQTERTAEMQVVEKNAPEPVYNANETNKCEDDKTGGDHQIFDIIANEESNEDKIKKISTLILDDVLKNDCNDEKKKQILEKENIEKRKISYVLRKKEKFTSIRGNRIKFVSEVRQDEGMFLYNDDDHFMYKDHIQNDYNAYMEEYTEQGETERKANNNNRLYKMKGKKYIKNISIDKLFQFHYSKLEKIVTSIDTNKFYEDYITASYSSTLDIGSFQNSKGNVAIFSYINPTYPLRLYDVNSSVLKIMYSNNNPNLLVATLSNGHINIYDTRNSDQLPVLKSTSIKSYHDNCFEPIYDICFKSNYIASNTQESIFYSAHENGHVYQWTIEKELKNKEILYLKNKKNDLYQGLSSVFENKNLSNKPFNSSLTCIDIDNYMNHDEDFIISTMEKGDAKELDQEHIRYENSGDNIPKGDIQELRKDAPKNTTSHEAGANKTAAMADPGEEQYGKRISREEELLNHYKNITENIIDRKIKPTHSYYYLGSKNGIIYRCNSCYQKSYLNYYVAHFGAVNKIKINEFDHDIFLSAGEDCTVKLWHKFSNKQITTFKSKNSFSSINDILWMPNNSTSFFCCSDDGRVELWDFNFLSKDPLIIFYPNVVEASKIICLKMFNKKDILLCGDNLGNVSMIKIKNLVDMGLGDYEQKMKLTDCLKCLDTYDYF
ncbi:conserved Plasmodium protein, unknown function [Plasmodium knowlesi strain H]|uniref:Uncharacterized protein n=3 Tax=Plasmodium knowlesi TaxID=5850 RepID=A0A5K1VSW2_PLAKH|nr:WD repeat-containing protein, putative [Plasmodium knowlesi strain H]OTN64170.1 Uncharacterized protein PKNOH_S140249500 [Plasmodium knowlesi]CAA9990914.1 WD repeat-containing protein, putative [Plasmodium knowlesi strain H]SBO20863.1 conserved Plasmodium protein, unknown function [Plasmodium knowlesi strain H]SBO21291.1 conserved Plasmodium protein, unknown function [Plasmodium knowlesi strain H]VVS80388.1 WD repeat-containing protein, putative [Plasmodium knowlesi strain H]|eukprot:XP_002262199.1 hypothetical protein, conserved in Plasmodium species [Plasmodium knowlesi strain H]